MTYRVFSEDRRRWITRYSDGWTVYQQLIDTMGAYSRWSERSAILAEGLSKEEAESYLYIVPIRVESEEV